MCIHVCRASAWVYTPVVGLNDAHASVECSNKGLCDRKSGECQCFDNYDGKEMPPSICFIGNIHIYMDR